VIAYVPEINVNLLYNISGRMGEHWLATASSTWNNGRDRRNQIDTNLTNARLPTAVAPAFCQVPAGTDFWVQGISPAATTAGK